MSDVLHVPLDIPAPNANTPRRKCIWQWLEFKLIPVQLWSYSTRWLTRTDVITRTTLLFAREQPSDCRPRWMPCSSSDSPPLTRFLPTCSNCAEQERWLVGWQRKLCFLSRYRSLIATRCYSEKKDSWSWKKWLSTFVRYTWVWLVSEQSERRYCTREDRKLHFQEDRVCSCLMNNRFSTCEW